MSMKRIFAMIMALALIATTMGGLTITASAEEEIYQGTDPYVIYYGANDGRYVGAYPTPYKVEITYKVVSDTPYEEFVGAIAMYNTNAETEELMTVYCVDQYTGVKQKTYYGRYNLEDSTFFTDDVAAKLRTVMIKGFPNVSNEELGAAAGIEDLRVCEAVHATQLAIWKLAYGEDMVINTSLLIDDSLYLTRYNNDNEDICKAEYEEVKNEDIAVLQSRVEAVYNYLLSLEPTAPSAEVVSDASFLDWTRRVTVNEDGTYTVDVSADVKVVMGDESDAMTLSLVLSDGTYVSTDLANGTGSYTLSITTDSAAVANSEVKLAIDGTQTASDVFFFAPDGNRNTAQSMIGMLNGQMPVHAEVSDTDRVLNILKTDYNGMALKNIIFDIYRVCSIEDYVSGNVVLGTGVTTVDGVEYFSAPTDADIAKYVTGQVPVATVITDANGKASVNFGTENDGIYIVAERLNDTTGGPVAPFFVAVPGGSSADNAAEYVINVQPKNTVIEEDVEIEKDVNQIDNDHDTHDVGEIHTWIIQTTIPAGLATGLKYEITDTLNYQLTYVGNVRVTVSEKTALAGEDLVTLVEGEDYILTVTPGTVTVGEGEATVEEAVTSFKVALTEAGMKKVAAVAPETEGTETEVRVYFDAYIDEDAIMGTEIPNQAHISYENNVGVDFDEDSDIPEVHTGALKVNKVAADDSTKRLDGAVFKIARAATAEELAAAEAAGEEWKDTLVVGGKTIKVVYVEFYDNAAMVGEKVTEAATENGVALFYGLAYGEYYLVETAAPDGYNKLTDPIQVTIDATSHLDENGSAVTVTNSAKFTLPSTGGIGTVVFTVVGVVIVAAAVILLVTGKKKSF